MGLESDLSPKVLRHGPRWSGSTPDFRDWNEAMAGRWQHAMRCATCCGLKPAPDLRPRQPGSHDSADSACRLP
jgi:hypothetical protein